MTYPQQHGGYQQPGQYGGYPQPGPGQYGGYGRPPQKKNNTAVSAYTSTAGPLASRYRIDVRQSRYACEARSTCCARSSEAPVLMVPPEPGPVPLCVA